jgi:NAD(P)-dependent dehydrogenase (short-subunit alcohol dehydrogenase family)
VHRPIALPPYYNTDPAAAEQGAIVTAHYHRNREPLQSLFDKYGPDRLQLAHGDLTSERDVQDIFKKMIWGAPEIVVVNHGIFNIPGILLRDMELAQWEQTLSVNLTASFLVAREYLRNLDVKIQATAAEAHLTEGASQRCFGDRAAIILVGSTAGKYGEVGHADYAASKSGVLRRYSSLTCELATTSTYSNDVWLDPVTEE